MKTPKLGTIIGYYMTEKETKKCINNFQRVAPAIVTSVYDDEFVNEEGIKRIGVNCRVLCDSDNILHKTSLQLGDQPGNYYLID